MSANKTIKAPYLDWSPAPEDATHALVGSYTLWLKLGEGDAIAHYWSRPYGSAVPATWKETSHPSSFYRVSKNVVARPGAEEVWSVTGDNGSWDYASLAELIRDNYGSREDGTSFGPGLGNGLKVGDTVRRAIVCKDDPAGFVPDADEILQHMEDSACDSDAGEWADGYPHVNDEARTMLEKALKPLKTWARTYCQPDFFTVKDITQHVIAEDDVRAVR